MAQQIVCDHIDAVGGILPVDVPITQRCVPHVFQVEKWYERYLDQQRQNKKSEEGNRKRKSLLHEIEELKEKKRRLTEDIDSLVRSADNLAEKAESTGIKGFMTQSNSLRRTAKEKTSVLNNVENEMEQKLWP